MQIAIIEDNAAEALSLKNQVSRLLPEEFGYTHIDVFFSADQFLNSDRHYDLMLIDCILPDISGVELAKKIRCVNNSTAFIFTTAFMEFAVEGYETNAIRYLLKPISDEKLKEALVFFTKINAPDPVVELTGTTRYATYAHMSDILYVEYVGRKIIVRLKGESVESHKTMKQFETELGTSFFFRTSPRFLVNYKHIAGKNNSILIMENGEHVTISGRKLTPFNHAYIRFLSRG